MYNRDSSMYYGGGGTGTGKMGPEKAGLYPKISDDTNFSWMWATAFAMGTAFFLVHLAMQKAGLLVV